MADIITHLYANENDLVEEKFENIGEMGIIQEKGKKEWSEA